jgi:hypothetical protein
MNTYIIPFDKNGKEILGNIDGHCVVNSLLYRRTAAYRRIKNTPKENLSLDGRAVLYKVIRDGVVLEEIKKD